MLFDNRNYNVYWKFGTPVTAGTDKAEDLRNDFAAIVAQVRQIYPRAFEYAEVKEYLDYSFYGIFLRFRVEDPVHSTIFDTVTEVISSNMDKVCSNWKLKYEIRPASSGWADRW